MRSTRMSLHVAGAALAVVLAAGWPTPTPVTPAAPVIVDAMMLAPAPILPAPQRLATTALPTGDQILARYEEALGGAAALAKVNGRTVWSRRIVDQGAPSDHVLLRYSKKPGLSIMRHENLDGTLHHWQNGCDANGGWSRGEAEKINSFAKGIAVGPICDQELYYYGYFPLDRAYMKESFKSLEVKGQMSLVQPEVSAYGALAGGTGPDLVGTGPRDAYLVLGMPARKGDIAVWMLFDKATGALLLRMHDNTPEPRGAGEHGVHTHFVQYRAVGDGTRASFQFITHNRSGSRVRGVHTKIDDTTPIDDKVFVRPKNALREDKGL